MTITRAHRTRAIAVWILGVAVLAGPVLLAATSPLLAYRDPIYIAAGLSGVVALGLLLLQPMLAGKYLPGISALGSRRAHRIVGVGLVAAVVIHVAGLWRTSPPDVIDALLFASPTPFSVWGVVAMWAVFAAALVAAVRRRMPPRIWRRIHTVLGVATVVGSVIHALLIFGTVEPVSKVILCTLVVAATGKLLADRRGKLRPDRRT